MKISFLNHAGFIVSHGAISLCCDPWITGRVFNEGWDLISKTQFEMTDFARVNFIWFSHEHPDHFCPSNLNAIPQEIRSTISVLVHRTVGSGIVRYCRSLNFKECILLDNLPFALGPDFSLSCQPFRGGDTWSYLQVADQKILNTNDCAILDGRDIAQIRKRIAKTDILLTKFSYSSWVGNPADLEFRRQVARRKLELMKLQIDFFQPRYTIPIGNNFFFSHEENSYLNDAVNRPSDVFRYLSTSTASSPVILYCGSEFTPDVKHDSRDALLRYDHDYASIKCRHLGRNSPVSRDQLQEAANDHWERSNSYGAEERQCRIQLWDHADIVVELSNRRAPAFLSQHETFDVGMSSGSCATCLNYPDGANSVRISGRLRASQEGLLRFLTFFRSACSDHDDELY